jgi:hypothetical protein
MAKKESIPDDGCGPLPESVFVEQYKEEGDDEVYLQVNGVAEDAFDSRSDPDADFVVVGQYKLVRRVVVRKTKPKTVVRSV